VRRWIRSSLDVNNHNKLWITTDWTMSAGYPKHKSRAFSGGILHHEGKLYVTNGSQMLGVLNLENGRILMTKKLPDIIVSAPQIHGNVILLLTLGNQLYAIDKDNGSLIWDHAGNPETLTYGNMSAPVIDAHNRIFVAYSSVQVFVLNP